MKNRFKKKVQKIAVVGMEGVFPKADNISQFINNIFQKKNSITPVPEHRWICPVKKFISQVPTPDKAICSVAGFIDHFNFDPTGFLIDKDLLSQLDPVHQLVLHASRQAFLQCSHTQEEKRRTGVILAAIALPTQSASRFSQQVIFGNKKNQFTLKDVSKTGVVSYPASILARAMGFEAGSFTLDAACASSLFSIKLACEHLSLKKADIMIAGGVSKPTSLYTQIGFTQLQALSPSGKCSPFDAAADGLIVGEGTGIVVLKRLEDAIRSKDKIHAVIAGCGVSNDIEGTLVGPASEGQVRAMMNAYEHASWSPLDIQYMECHGSGTPVGDQVELSSIKTLLDNYSCPQKLLSIGSVKSMIGHLLTAAGAAGFIKTVLSMNEGILPPSLNFVSPSDKSPLNNSHIRVQTQAEEWKPEKTGITRKAGVSAFGFGGINAHILVEEFDTSAKNYPVTATKSSESFESVVCAIVGMETITKGCDNLAQFQKSILETPCIKPDFPDHRWKRFNTDLFGQPSGFYLDQIQIGLGQFHIPPNQMGDILPQHIVLLKAVYGALKDANIDPRPLIGEQPRDYIGCSIGIDFDYGATDFHLRWQINGLDEVLKNHISPPLTFNRTLGALGGIVASRVAREFKLGGPCFTLSAAQASGIKSIETAVHSLSVYETDVYICGCVDLMGDVRQSVLNQLIHSKIKDSTILEGSAALVLKRYDQAIDDGDKIYAVIKGIGSSGGDLIPGEDNFLSSSSQKFKDQSLKRALADAKVSTKDINLYESDSFNSGAVSALFSIIKTALFLSSNKPQKASVASTTSDGAYGHVIMEDHPAPHPYPKIKETQPEFEKNIFLKTNPRFVKEEIVLKAQNYLEINDKIMEKTNHTKCIQDKSNKDTFCIIGESQVPMPAAIDPGIIACTSQATANAHEKFLEFSTHNMQRFEKQFNVLTHMARQTMQQPGEFEKPMTSIKKEQPPFLDRDMCLEYAIGKAGNVLGEKFDIIDTYPARVRLPAEPLMLVDRIMEIQGEMLSLGPGKIVTQHDVKSGAWYLDGPKAPVSISIEAGQADLFLCAWLGIDHAVKGKRKYRLLDARVTFHRTLPEAYETIEYHIEIDRFLKQGDVYLFFFHYKGYIDGQLLISMRDGCAGFFTELEVENSGGIVLKNQDKMTIENDHQFNPLVQVKKQEFNDQQVDSLRSGNIEAAFGGEFKGIILGKNLKLPGGRMHLIDRVLEFDPFGGQFGKGSITAQSDIHPDDWFLTCHFIDDMVMPGTLMYDCCAHALRIFTQRIGWITDRDDVYYDVVLENESDLKCRGPVTPLTKHARYEIQVKEIGYGPEPYIIADAHMFSDDLQIVLYKNMGLKLVGLTQSELKSFWRKQ